MAQQAKKKQAATDASSEAPVQPFSTRHPSLLGLAFPPLAAHLALLSLPPLFGFSPSNTYTHVHVLAASIPFLTLLPRSSETGLLVTHGLLAACCALWFHYLRLIGSWSNELGVVTGPLVAWAGVGVLGSIVVRDSVSDLLQFVRPKPSSTTDSLVYKTVVAILSANVFFLVQAGWERFGTIEADKITVIHKILYVYVAGHVWLARSNSTSLLPPRVVPKWLLPLVFLPLTLLRLPSSPSPMPSLLKQHSKTGLVIVAEHTLPSGLAFRYLRADHSLLGGRWILDTLDDDAFKIASQEMSGLLHGGQGVGESIFSAFVLQEAVRLIARVGEPEDGTEEQALVIGLGVGISARSLILHGLPTTVVEFEPVVYDAARKFFQFPRPEAIYLEDANAFVQRTSGSDGGEIRGKFGVVIHDVFTGGAVPGELFTVEFWHDLRALMKPNGVLAINFAGIQRTHAASLVISTLLATFPACRGFRDALGESQDHDDGALKNMVIFCSAHLPSSNPSPSSPSRLPPQHEPSAVTFHRPAEADYLGSFLRKRVFDEFESHEVDLREFGSWRKDGSAEGEVDLLWRGEGGKMLEKLQRGSGVATWKAMRELMPVEVWNSW